MLVDTNFIEDRRVRKEAKTLLDAGYQVTVIAIRNWIGMGTKLPGKRVQMFQGIKLIYIESKISKFPIGILRFILNFISKRVWDSYLFTKYAICEKADTYHSHDLDTLLEGFIAAKLNHAKLIYDSHDYFPEIRSPGSNVWRIYGPYWKFMEKHLISYADRVITVCDLFANEYPKFYGIPRPEIIYNCSELIPYKKQNIIRERFKIPNEKKVLLFLGSLYPGRGVEITIDSSAYLEKDITLVMIGPSSEKYREQIRERATKIGKIDIIIAPPIPPWDVYSYLMSADLGIIYYESLSFSNNGLSNKLFDYMMAGLPIVASSMSETKRVIQETQCGVAMENADAKDFASAISKVLKDYESLCFYRNNARRAAETKYNWSIEAKKLLNLYTDVLHLKRHD